MRITLLARRTFAIYERLRREGRPARDAVRAAVVASAAWPGSALHALLADAAVPEAWRARLRHALARCERSEKSDDAAGRAEPASRIHRYSGSETPLIPPAPFAEDAAALAAAAGEPLGTRHLLLSAWRQMRSPDPARAVPTRFLLDLVQGDRAAAQALYLHVLHMTHDDSAGSETP